MKIALRKEACVGHGLCSFSAPEIYELDDDGYCDLTEREVPEAQREAATDGADNCPERAITVLPD